MKLFFIVFFSGFYVSGNAFFEIVELMPNTIDDKSLEYVTLKNISDTQQSLSWYVLSDKKKQYTFSEDVFLNPDEKKQFFRTKTKLILNNTNEQIFLHNNKGELIDEIEYKTSVKWEFLIFEDVAIWWIEDIISDETLSSRRKHISDEVSIDTTVELNTWSGHSSDIDDILSVPEIMFSLQRPSYITQSGSTNQYVCDGEKDECKVNFDLRDSFWPNFSQWDYVCDINFGIWEPTWQEWRCNPNTVTFPEWEFEMKIKILHESDENIFSEKTILINNIPVIQSDTSLSKTNSLWIENEEEGEENKIYILRPKIIVQSWLSWEGRYFYCVENECKINLNYEKQHKDERCFWDFADMQQSSKTTHTRCNPWYVTVTQWVHEMTLRVYEKNNEDNKKKIDFYVYNTPPENTLLIEDNSITSDIAMTWDTESIDIYYKSEKKKLEIKLQWKISQEKTHSWSVLLCQWVERCYVNLEWISQWIDDEVYNWQLNWEDFSQKLNPKWIWIEWTWTHEITLQSWELEQLFLIHILVEQISNPKLDDTSVQIESWEWVEEEKIDFTQNFLVLKYDGLRISGKAPLWSKIEIYSSGEKILEGESDEKWKYRLVSKKYKIWNHVFDTKIILSSWEEVYLKNSWEFLLKEDKTAKWFLTKKLKAAAKKKISAIKHPKLIMEVGAFDEAEGLGEELSVGTQIFLFIIISLSAVFGIIHLILVQWLATTKNLFQFQKVIFSTRQKICIILP